MEKELTLTVKEMAAALKISLPTAYQMTEQPGFPLIRIGRKKLIRRAALEKWLDEVGANGRSIM